MIGKANTLYFFILFLFIVNLSIAEPFAVGDFSTEGLKGWKEKEFKGATSYQLVDLNFKIALRAESHNSASGLVKKIRVDLKNPF